MKISEENKEFFKRLYILALPMVVQGFLDSAVQIMDTVMIGSLGTETIAGVGIANQVFFIFVLFVFGIGSGCNIFIGQYFGSKNHKNIKKIMGVGLVSSMTIGVIFALIAFAIPDKLLRLYSSDPIVIEIGLRYIRIVSLTYVLVSISFILHNSIKSVQQPKYSTMTTALTLATNTTLNYIFIFKLNMGVEGAAIATVIARTLELITLITIIYKKKLIIAGKLKDYFDFDFSIVKLYYSKAFFIILNEVMWAFGVSTYTMSYGIVGTTGQAAVQISNNASNLFMVTGMAIGGACCIMLADMLGAKQNKEAIDYSKKFSLTAIGVSIFMSLLFILLAPIIVRVFHAEPNVADNVYKITYVMAVTNIFKTYNYVGICGILRSGGDTIFTTALDCFCVWCVGVPLAYIGAKYFGLPIYFVVLCASMEEIIKTPIMYARIRRNKWANTLV